MAGSGCSEAARPFHDHATRWVEPATRFVFDDRTERCRDVLWGDDVESESRIERHVPGYVSKRCQRDGAVPVAGGPLTHFQDQFRSKATAAVVGMNVDLLEMDRAALDQLGVREPYGNIVGQSDP